MKESAPSERGSERTSRRGKRRQRAKDRQREREREKHREGETDRQTDKGKGRDGNAKTERKDIERETGGCRGCFERQCVIEGAGARESARADTTVRISSEPACPEGVLEGCGPPKGDHKGGPQPSRTPSPACPEGVLEGCGPRASRNTLAL